MFASDLLQINTCVNTAIQNFVSLETTSTNSKGLDYVKTEHLFMTGAYNLWQI